MQSLTDHEAETLYHVADDDTYSCDPARLDHYAISNTITSLLFQLSYAHQCGILPTSGPFAELITVIGRAVASCNSGIRCGDNTTSLHTFLLDNSPE
jgi:hypothetical protein